MTSSTLNHSRDYEIKESKVFFSSESALKIKGKTNVSKFECEFNMKVLSDSIGISYMHHNDHLKFTDTKLRLPNFHFDCGGKGINKDFHQLLNSEEYPQILIILKELVPIESTSKSAQVTVEIVISNVMNTYSVPIQIDTSDQLLVSGTLPLNINDFNLSPPSKVMGMIKVSPIIEIEFQLYIMTC